jgi:hypothetical protein
LASRKASSDEIAENAWVWECALGEWAARAEEDGIMAVGEECGGSDRTKGSGSDGESVGEAV